MHRTVSALQRGDSLPASTSSSSLSEEVNHCLYTAPPNELKPSEEYYVEWTRNEEVDSCMVCDNKFTLFVRRHHCRSCGDVVCGSCAEAKREVYGLVGMHRVCDACLSNGVWVDPVARRRLEQIENSQYDEEYETDNSNRTFIRHDSGAIGSQDEQEEEQPATEDYDLEGDVLIVPDEDGEELQELLAFYDIHAPNDRHTAKEQLNFYKGNRELMWRMLCTRYNVSHFEMQSRLQNTLDEFSDDDTASVDDDMENEVNETIVEEIEQLVAPNAYSVEDSNMDTVFDQQSATRNELITEDLGEEGALELCLTCLAPEDSEPECTAISLELEIDPEVLSYKEEYCEVERASNPALSPHNAITLPDRGLHTMVEEGASSPEHIQVDYRLDIDACSLQDGKDEASSTSEKTKIQVEQLCFDLDIQKQSSLGLLQEQTSWPWMLAFGISFGVYRRSKTFFGVRLLALVLYLYPSLRQWIYQQIRRRPTTVAPFPLGRLGEFVRHRKDDDSALHFTETSNILETPADRNRQISRMTKRTKASNDGAASNIPNRSTKPPVNLPPRLPLRKQVSEGAPNSPKEYVNLQRHTSMDSKKSYHGPPPPVPLPLSPTKRIKKHFRQGIRLIANASYKGLRELDKKWIRVPAPEKHRREDEPYNVMWVEDDDLFGCMLCQVPFGMYFRRHHCRSCGDLVCSDCSKGRKEVYGLVGWHRVCDACIHSESWVQPKRNVDASELEYISIELDASKSMDSAIEIAIETIATGELSVATISESSLKNSPFVNTEIQSEVTSTIAPSWVANFESLAPTPICSFNCEANPNQEIQTICSLSEPGQSQEMSVSNFDTTSDWPRLLHELDEKDDIVAPCCSCCTIS